jgi:hypothetical protein
VLGGSVVSGGSVASGGSVISGGSFGSVASLGSVVGGAVEGAGVVTSRPTRPLAVESLAVPLDDCGPEWVGLLVGAPESATAVPAPPTRTITALAARTAVRRFIGNPLG